MNEPSLEGARAGHILKHLKKTELDLDVIVVEEMVSIGRLSLLAPGSILKFDKKITEEVELSIGKKIVAKGNVVRSGANYALEIKQMVP
jgi:flagellar motor switch/type III secretory pathway protein FliN